RTRRRCRGSGLTARAGPSVPRFSPAKPPAGGAFFVFFDRRAQAGLIDVPLPHPHAVDFHDGYEFAIFGPKARDGIDVDLRPLAAHAHALEHGPGVVAQRAPGAGVELDAHRLTSGQAFRGGKAKGPEISPALSMATSCCDAGGASCEGACGASSSTYACGAS